MVCVYSWIGCENLFRAPRPPFSIFTFLMLVGDFMFQIADIWLATTLRDQISQELPRSHPKGAFLRVWFHLVFSEEVECFAQVVEVVRTLDTLHKHVDVHFHGMLDPVLEYSVGHLLEGGSDILQSGGHDMTL